MNKSILFIVIGIATLLTGTFLVFAEEEEGFDPGESHHYSQAEFYQEVPVEEWDASFIQVDNIPEDEYHRLNEMDEDQLLTVEGDLNEEQLGELKSDSIKKIIDEIDSQQLGAMSPDEVENLDRNDAHEYFDQRLDSHGYNVDPQNENEIELLKKIESFSNVDFESMQNLENIEVGEEGATDFLNTPDGTVYLDSAANVEFNEGGVLEDAYVEVLDSDGNDGVRMGRSGKDEGHISYDDGEFLLEGDFDGEDEAPYTIIEDGEEIGDVNPLNDPVHVNFDGEERGEGNYISLEDERVEAMARDGEMHIDLSFPPIDEYVTNAEDGGRVVTNLHSAEGEEYQVITDSKFAGVRGEVPFSVGFNQKHSPEEGHDIVINQYDTEVEDHGGGGIITTLKDSLRSFFVGDPPPDYEAAFNKIKIEGIIKDSDNVEEMVDRLPEVPDEAEGQPWSAYKTGVRSFAHRADLNDEIDLDELPNVDGAKELEEEIFEEARLRIETLE